MPDPHPFAPAESHLFTLLTSAEGLAVQAAIAAAPPTNATSMRVATQLRKRYPADLVAAAMTLHDLRVRGREKFADAANLYFTRPGLEQATSERIAQWRATRYASSATVVDLCTGIGGDLMALAQTPGITRLIAVDLDPDHLAMASHNARVAYPGIDLIAFCRNVRAIDVSRIDAAFIDPARRDSGGRFGIGTSEPPLDWVFALADRVPKVGVKTAPGISHDLVPAGWELETIALGTDLKEAVLWSPGMATTSRRATIISSAEPATLIDDGIEEPIDLAVPVAGMWLHDPNPAITRAGLVETLARMIGGRKIDDQIGFLVTPDNVVSRFTRELRILASVPWNEREVKAVLKSLDAGTVDIRRRGLAGDVDTIARRLRGKGARPIALAMTRVQERPWAIVCENVARSRP